MNVELYAIETLAVILILTFLFVLISNRRHFYKQIDWLKQQIANRDKTITDLQNRLMSKNFDQYKMYEQPMQNISTEEPEPFFDDGAVGKITEAEIDIDA